MLPLDSDRWRQLSHAYGDASDVPDQLRRIYDPSDNETVWSLYDNVLHQSSVSDSAYAVVPHVVAAAKSVGVEHWLPYLCVVATTNDGIDRKPIPEDLRQDYLDAVEAARVMGLEFISRVPVEDHAIPYVFEIVASTHGFPELARILHDLSNEQFRIECDECGSPLYIETDDVPFRVFAEVPSVFAGKRLDVSPTQITPAQSGEGTAEQVGEDVPSDGRFAMGWLCNLARENGYTGFAARISTMYGNCVCPVCRHQFGLYDELER